MADYSYSEIQNMQQKAMARVRQMQKNTNAVRISANEEMTGARKKDNTGESNAPAPMPKVTNMPPNFPQNFVHPNFKQTFSEMAKKESSKSSSANMTKPKANNLEAIFAEPERAMLMGLITLLKSEGADEMLIMALMYILS